MNSTTAARFVGRILAGILIAIFLGRFIDEKFNIAPFTMIVMLFYVIAGSLYALVKEAGKEDGKK